MQVADVGAQQLGARGRVRVERLQLGPEDLEGGGLLRRLQPAPTITWLHGCVVTWLHGYALMARERSGVRGKHEESVLTVCASAPTSPAAYLHPALDRPVVDLVPEL